MSQAPILPLRKGSKAKTEHTSQKEDNSEILKQQQNHSLVIFIRNINMPAIENVGNSEKAI